MFEEKEGKKRNLFFTRAFFILGIILIFVIAFLYFPDSFKSSKEEIVCGDGTIYNECSENKPYFCEQGKLIEKASFCGCSDGSIPNTGDSCYYEFKEGEKKIVLTYILRGEKNKLNFTVYKKANDYISNLSRTIRTENEIPSRRDFKLKSMNQKEQRALLLPLVAEIQNMAEDKDDQMRIAVSLVQEIPFGASEKQIDDSFFGKTDYSRYPYEVLYDQEGVCGEKSELLAFLLREMGYGVVFFYHRIENHESIGVECPTEYSLDGTGYCFIETSGSSIITNNELTYVGGIRLFSTPELIFISEGNSLSSDLYEYRDTGDMKEILRDIRTKNKINLFQAIKLKKLEEKYGLADSYNL